MCRVFLIIRDKAQSPLELLKRLYSQCGRSKKAAMLEKQDQFYRLFVMLCSESPTFLWSVWLDATHFSNDCADALCGSFP